MKLNRELLGWMSIAALAGVGGVIVPYVMFHGFGGKYDSPLFPLVRNAWEKVDIHTTAVILLIVGALLGMLRPRQWFILGASTAFLFPVAALLEIAVDPRSHNLWPLEFMMYAALVAGPAILGAFAASIIRTRHEHAT